MADEQTIQTEETAQTAVPEDNSAEKPDTQPQTAENAEKTYTQAEPLQYQRTEKFHGIQRFF